MSNPAAPTTGGLSTHVLDTSLGRPAAGVRVTLERQAADSGWSALHEAQTDSDGRVKQLLPAGTKLEAGTYRLTFHTRDYFGARNTESFYPEVRVVFAIGDAGQHYHVPLLLSPYGYSTYRGS